MILLFNLKSRPNARVGEGQAVQKRIGHRPGPQTHHLVHTHTPKTSGSSLRIIIKCSLKVYIPNKVDYLLYCFKPKVLNGGFGYCKIC